MSFSLKAVQIGDTVVPHGLFLAPMAGFTDLEFRRICHENGAEYTVTEMISAAAVCFGDKKTGELAKISPCEGPVALQVFGHEEGRMEEAVRRLLGEMYRETEEGLPAAVDINMGCPVKKIVTSGDGSALMRDPSLCARLTEAAVRGARDFGVPVTVKIRAGFDGDRKNAPEVALAAVSGGASAVFVHGRTRDQFYAPSSDNGVIAAVRDALPSHIPVIGNGDVTSPEDAERMIRETGCDGIMIGRGALGDPWLFGRIIAASEGRDIPLPTEDERKRAALELCIAVCGRYGEARGVPMCRGRAGHFIKGLRGAPQIRDRLCHASTINEIKECLGGQE